MATIIVPGRIFDRTPHGLFHDEWCAAPTAKNSERSAFDTFLAATPMAQQARAEPGEIALAQQTRLDQNAL